MGHARSSYAKLVGEIAIAWNQIEREINNLIFHYMGGDAQVAGFILGNFGNQTKTDFLLFLVDRFEKDADVAQAAKYAATLVNRIRENRNIIEHAIPLISHDNRYHGDLVKLDKKSNFKAFDAPIELVREVAKSADQTKTWLRALRTTAYMTSNPDNHAPNPMGATTAEAVKLWISSLERPPLPEKMNPLQPEAAPTNGKHSPQS